MRVKDLNLQISGTELEPSIERLEAELSSKNICFRPAFYFTEEWLCPDKEPIIGIPFCLAHPRLKALESLMMYEVEGGTAESCIRLLRHECGHAINYAYRLYRRTRWRELFGAFSQRYSDSYPFRPYSKRFVIHLENHYAQCHPDEDFAETFAVWLDPNNKWQQKYKNWPALSKLEYVENLMKRIGDQKPLVPPPSSPPWTVSRMRSTLLEYYTRKRSQLGKEFKGYYDDTLKSVLSFDSERSDVTLASAVLRKYRSQIVDYIAQITGHRKYDIHRLLSRIIERCHSLKLYTSDDSQGLIGIMTLVTAIACRAHRTCKRGIK